MNDWRTNLGELFRSKRWPAPTSKKLVHIAILILILIGGIFGTGSSPARASIQPSTLSGGLTGDSGPLSVMKSSKVFLPLLMRKGPAPAPISGPATQMRPYTANSPWNTPIGSSPRYDPHSTEMVASIGKDSDGQIFTTTTGYSYTLYFADKSTPRWNIPCGSGNCTIVNPDGTYGKADVLQNVPIPSGAKPASGSDATMIVVDQDTLAEYDLRNLLPDTNGSGYKIDNGALYNLAFDGAPERYSTRGAGVPYYAGLLRPWEIAQGHIDHALAFSYPYPDPGCVYPASKGDGGYSGGIPEGARLQLDPTLTDAYFDSLGLDRAGKIIAHALQDYGMIVVNVAGRPKIAVENLTNNPLATIQWSDPAYNLQDDSITKIPYTSFRVIALPDAYWNPTPNSPTHGQCFAYP